MEKEMWLITFNDGSEFVTFSEGEIIEQFGPNENGTTYSVQKGIWTPTTEE